MACEVPIHDVIVVGAGPAGLLGAIRSAERGRATLLLEKNRKAGVKILISGGTRCNLTHDCDERGIIEAFGLPGRFLHAPLAALSPRDLLDLFHAEGLPTKVEANGKIFPQSDRSIDVVQSLLRRLTRSGAKLSLGEAVTNIAKRENTFHITTSRGVHQSRKLLITTGGLSYPGCGTTGDGYRWLTNFGHAVRATHPALVPLTTDLAWVQQLSGVTIPDVWLRVTNESARDKRRNGRPLMERRGAMLFTHFGLSGPAVLDVSRAFTGADESSAVTLDIDFLPNDSAARLDERLRGLASSDGKRQVMGLVSEWVPRRLVEALFARAHVSAERRAAELSTSERTSLVVQLKQTAIAITGSRGFEKAEVTAGGIDLREVDSRTMQSKLVPNLYLAGEILDLDGFIGGYNFQAAFSTGWLAGESV